LHKRENLGDIGLPFKLLFGKSNRFGRSVAGSKEQVEGLLQQGNAVDRKTMTLQAHRIETVQMGSVPAGGERKWRNILTNGATTANHHVVSDAHKLKNTGQSSDDGMITDGDVSRKACRIGHNNMVAEPAIVCHMHVGHQNALRPKRGHSTPLDGSPVHRDILPDSVVVADDDLGRLPLVSKVLWRPSDRSKRMHLVPLPNLRPPINRHMREQSASLSDCDMLPDYTEWPDLNVTIEARLGMNDRCRMYLHACPLYSRQTSPVIGQPLGHCLAYRTSVFSSITIAVTMASQTTSLSTYAFPCIFQNGGRFLSTSISKRS